MNLHNPGAAIASYRDQTERQKRMPGVTAPSFICKACGESRRVSGRKRVSMGWVCKSCHEVSA